MGKVSSTQDTLDSRDPSNSAPSPVVGVARRSGPPDEVSPALLAAAQRGERDALETFILHYQHRVFAFISRATGAGTHVEDLAQEVFLRVFRALPQFVVREAKVSTWIFQIAVRLIQDRRKRYRPVLVHMSEELIESSSGPERNVGARQSLARLQQLAAELPEEQRMALVLMEFHGLPHDEVARVMGCSVSTVKTRVHRARAFLRSGMRDSAVELLT